MTKSNNRIISLAITLLMIVSAAFSVRAEETAAAIVKRCADRFAADKTVEVEFALEAAARPANGRIIISGNKFMLKLPSLQIWFDGKTQWSYMSEAGEVNVTEPDARELLETNPFEILRHANSLFTARKLQSPKSSDIINLAPKSPSSALRSVRVVINRATGWPTQIVVTDDNSSTISVSITKCGYMSQRPADSTFRFNPKDYPKVEIIDLR